MPLGERISELQRRLFGASIDDLRKIVSTYRNQIADLRVEFNRIRAELRRIREELQKKEERKLPELTLDEVLALHPGCHDALERFEIHGSGSRTLAAACQEANAELDTVVATIKNLLKDKG